MRFSAATLLITALGWITAVTAHNIQLKAHSRECFHESLHKDDRMTVTFQVGDREFGGSGNLEIDFWVWNPCDAVGGWFGAALRWTDRIRRPLGLNPAPMIPFLLFSERRN